MTRAIELKLQELEAEAELIMASLTENHRKQNTLRNELAVNGKATRYTMTTQQLLSSMGVSKKDLDCWCERNSNRFPYITVANKRYFDPKQVAEWFSDEAKRKAIQPPQS